ncbi:hypothetical protein GCM10012278_63940 [Nonomuraea glycinis]|uniref:Uncharacterized protein n=1 Tax=Nonomuraea glycinis TaxID=2047744 RepID=A0A918ABA6_9ACTN|nr:hypothetical protein GCM10012278_63940 [Nonomuraea glycinis]
MQITRQVRDLNTGVARIEQESKVTEDPAHRRSPSRELRSAKHAPVDPAVCHAGDRPALESYRRPLWAMK